MLEVILFGSLGSVALFFVILGIVLYKKYTTGCTERIIGHESRSTTNYHYGRSANRQNVSTQYYEYDYNGEHYEVKGHWNFESPEVEGGVELFIDPSDPKRHYRKADLKAALLFSGLGTAMLLIMIYVYVSNM